MNRTPDYAKAIDLLHRVGDTAHIPLLTNARDSVVNVAIIIGSKSSVPFGRMRTSRLPVVVVVAADEGRPSPPSEWRCARNLARWARFAIIHAAGGQPEHYQAAVNCAVTYGNSLMIETGTDHAAAWLEVLANVPKVLIWPTDGAHPIAPEVVH